MILYQTRDTVLVGIKKVLKIIVEIILCLNELIIKYREIKIEIYLKSEYIVYNLDSEDI